MRQQIVSTTWVCDRCERKFPNALGSLLPSDWITFCATRVDSMGNTDRGKSVDLCPFCLDELNKWLAKKPAPSTQGVP